MSIFYGYMYVSVCVRVCLCVPKNIEKYSIIKKKKNRKKKKKKKESERLRRKSISIQSFPDYYKADQHLKSVKFFQDLAVVVHWPEVTL